MLAGIKSAIALMRPPQATIEEATRTEAELLSDQDRANELLAQAIDAADDPGAKAGLCYQLASRHRCGMPSGC